jgi:hypothetical protein
VNTVLPLTVEAARELLAREGPAVAAVRKVVAEVGTPAEAWEILEARAMTPSADAPWLAWTPRACAFCGGLGTYWRYVPRIDGGDVVMCASCKGLTVDAPEPVPVPDSIELVVALAGDPEGIARCSLLAVEALARLSRWSDHPVSAPRVVWRTASRLLAWNDGPETVPWSRGRRLFEHVTSRVRVAAERTLSSRERRELRQAFAPLRGVARARWPFTADILEAALLWSRCPGAVIPPTEPCRFTGCALDTLVNPFAPMVEVLAAGHAFDAFLDDAVVLVVSPRTAPDVTPSSA